MARILEDIAQGRYQFAQIRSAAGRLHPLIGISPAQYADIELAAREHNIGFVLLGSRVTGPRTQQHQLHPALKALPLNASRRTPSPSWPGAENVSIAKDAIKEFGLEDVRTSDLTVFIIDSQKRPLSQLEDIARRLEDRFRAYGCSFALKVFTGWDGVRWTSEEDFIRNGAGQQLRGLLAQDHTFSEQALAQAVREIYAPVNLPRPWFSRRDVANGAINAVVATTTFTLALGFHPIVTLVGFAFGFGGRYLARLKATVAAVAGRETVASNAAALAVDGAIGIAVMGFLVNPLAGYGIAWPTILWASILHTLSKGSVRLALDKHFAGRNDRQQSLGVLITLALNTAQGLATAYIYAGSPWAAPAQMLMGAAGLVLVFRKPLHRLLGGTIATLEA
jgi:hypothetical protein